MNIKNATIPPKVYYGLHFCEGVAEYREDGKEPYRIFIREQVAKQMDPTFAGKPLYVEHVEDVKLEEIEQADGYIAESFYNKIDGKHWAKFIVVTDKGHEAIRKGWTLSNAYKIKQSSQGGQWHGVDYAKEVEAGEYEHLAIVSNPRYDESMILTPEEFKEYNSKKEMELQKIANSKKEGEKPMFNLFKREKVENSADLMKMSVTLPKSKKEVELEKAINMADELASQQPPIYAAGDAKVKVGEVEYSVNELVEKYNELDGEKKKAAAMAEEKEKEMKDAKNKEDEADKDKKENKDEEKSEEEKKANAMEAAKAKANADLLKNAESIKAKERVNNDKDNVWLSREDRAQLGKERYG